jgi:DeoR/GlpR family transcriptional regulator of sugar metabolism
MKPKPINILNKRQQNIIDIARNDGFITVDKLSKFFKVTEQTIRRDLAFFI